jgi:hypothetical protein
MHACAKRVKEQLYLHRRYLAVVLQCYISHVPPHTPTHHITSCDSTMRHACVRQIAVSATEMAIIASQRWHCWERLRATRREPYVLRMSSTAILE